MTDLSGNLALFEPINLFQLIHNSRLTGRLDLVTDDNRAEVYFEEGNIAFADLLYRPERLGEVLMNSGALERETLEGFLKDRKTKGKLGDRLVQSGVVSEETIRNAVESQIQEAVYLSVRWRTGTFRFAVGVMPEGNDVRNELPLDHLMLEGVRRMDEDGVEE